MKQFSHQERRALSTCLLALYTPPSLTSFATQVLHALPTVIPADSLFYVQINFHTPHASTAVVEPEDLAFAADDRDVATTIIREHPIVHSWRETRSRQACLLSDFLTQQQYHRLHLYHAYYRPRAIEHQLAVRLPSDSRHMIAVVFNRTQQAFSERDRSCLNLLRRHLSLAHQNAYVFTQMQQDITRLELGELKRGVIVLEIDGRVRVWTEKAQRWIQEYFEALSPQASFLPTELQRWVKHRQSLFTQDEDMLSPNEPLVIEREGKRLVIRFVPDHLGTPCLLLEEQQTTDSVQALEKLALTKREAEVVLWVADGKSNMDIGEILSVSPRTVQKHLEHIYEKLGVENRTAAANRVLEVLGPTNNS